MKNETNTQENEQLKDQLQTQASTIVELQKINSQLLRTLEKSLDFMNYVHNDPDNCFCGDNAVEYEKSIKPLIISAITKAEGK